MAEDWTGDRAWTGTRTIAVLWRDADGAWTIRRINVDGCGPGTRYTFEDTGEVVTAEEILAMASAKRRQELASVRAYHARSTVTTDVRARKVKR